MVHLLEIAGTGLAAVLLHPLRSLVCVVALAAVLVPYLVGMALSQGLQAEAEASARFGADLYVTGGRFGRPAPLPREAAQQIRQMDGVADASPRIVGEIVLGKDRIPAVLVGLPEERLTDWHEAVDGKLPQPGGPYELVIGTTLADLLHLEIGATLPPFYRNDRGERLARVVGIFRRECPPWEARLVLTTLDSAAEIFDQPHAITDVLVTCRRGYQAAVARRLAELPFFSHLQQSDSVRVRVTSREELVAVLPSGLLHRGGVFQLHFVLAFAVGILVLFVTSGLGLAERRREIGILKATGWQTDEILLRGGVESLCLSMAAACGALLLAWLWLRVGNAYGVASYFLAGVGTAPDFPVPFRLAPVPALLGFVIALALVMTGTLYPSYRAATTPPREAMR
jgi:ABC-type lipoprotein release transport system permease subunit